MSEYLNSSSPSCLLSHSGPAISRLGVVLPLEILVIINQARDKTVAKTWRQQVFFLKNNVPMVTCAFRNAGEEKVVWELFKNQTIRCSD